MCLHPPRRGERRPGSHYFGTRRRQPAGRAQCRTTGDVITLEPGATYIGNFLLPNKGAITDYITLRSAAPDAALPPPGRRMTPAYAPLLPEIKSPNSTSALRTAAAANHWKLMFLEDQIVLSAARYLTVSPGALKDDTTILPR